MSISVSQLMLIQLRLDEFEDAWCAVESHQSAVPDLIDYLQDITVATHLDCLSQLIAIDMEHRLKNSRTSAEIEAISVENYLQRFPELQGEPALVVELVCAEYRCLARHHHSPEIQEYVSRFPLLPDLPQRLSEAATELQSERVQFEIDLPDYQLMNIAGEGGRGIVYRAWQKKLRRFVAVKVLKSGSQVSEDEQRRFRREGETLARLNHPNIVKIHSVENVAGQNVLIMEWVDGCSLEEAAKRSDMSIGKSVRIMREICAAAAAAHAQGILHRDIKPANILISKTGPALVTDFGLAKDVHDLTDNTKKLTRTREIIGTPCFMPPEQIDPRFGEIGPWSDLYSIGATFYCILTGRPPLRGSTMWETFELILNDDPVSPRQLNPHISKDTETVCLKCLAKKPSDRYASAEDLAAELDRLIRGEPVVARPISRINRLVAWSRKNQQQAALAALSISAITLLLLGSIVGVLFYSRLYYSEQSERQRAAVALARVEASQYASHIREAQLQYERNYFVGMKNALQRAKQNFGQIDGRDWEWYYLNSLMEQGNQRYVVGTEHVPWVGACRITDDGRFLLAGSTVPWYESMDQNSTASLRVWDTNTQSELFSVDLPGNACSDVAISSDGSKVAACIHQANRARDADYPDKPSSTVAFSSSSTRLLIFNTQTKDLLRSIDWAERDYTCLQFDDSASILFTLSPAGLVAIDLNTGTRMWAKSGIKAFCKEGELIFVEDEKPAFLQLQDGQSAGGMEARLAKPRLLHRVRTMATDNLDPKQPRIQRCFNWFGKIEARTHENQVFVEAIQDRVLLASFQAESSVSAMAFSDNDELLAVGRGDGAIELWNLSSKAKLHTMAGHHGQVNHLQFFEQNQKLLSAGWDGELLIWDLQLLREGAKRYGVALSSESPFEAFALNAEGQLRGVQLNMDILTSWQLADPAVSRHEALPTVLPATAPGRSAAISADGTKLVFANFDRNSAECWDRKSNQHWKFQSAFPLRLVEMEHTGAFAGFVSWAFDEADILTTQLQVFRVNDGKPIMTQTIQGRRIWRMAINEPRRLLAVLETEPNTPRSMITDNRTTNLALWNLDSQSLIWRRPLDIFAGLYLGLAFSQDGTKIAVGELAGNIEILRVDTGEMVVEVEDGIENLEDLCFNPNGTRIAGVSRKQIVLWDALNGYRLLSLPQLQTNFDPIFNPQVVFSPDGKMMATNDYQQTLRVWSSEQ